MQQPRFNELFTNRLIAIFGEPRKIQTWNAQFYGEMFDSIGTFKEAVLEEVLKHIRENSARWPSIKEMKGLCFKFHRELKEKSGEKVATRPGKTNEDYRKRAEDPAREFVNNFKALNQLWQMAVEEKFEVTLTWVLFGFAEALWHTKLRMEDGEIWDDMNRRERPPELIADHDSSTTEKRIMALKFDVSLEDLRRNNEISISFDPEFISAIRRYEEERAAGEARYYAGIAGPKLKGASQVATELSKRLSIPKPSDMLGTHEDLEKVTEKKFEFK